MSVKQDPEVLSRKEILGLLAKLGLKCYQWDLQSWSFLRYAAAAALSAAVCGSGEFDRPIPPLADAIDALLGSAGVYALAISDGPANSLKCVTLDGRVTKLFTEGLERPCELCKVTFEGKSAIVVSNKHKNEAVIVHAFDWNQVLNRIDLNALGGKWPDGISALHNLNQFCVVCDESSTFHSFDAETGKQITQQRWGYNFVNGMTHLGKNRIALASRGQPISVIDGIGGQLLATYNSVKGGHGKIFLHSATPTMFVYRDSILQGVYVGQDNENIPEGTPLGNIELSPPTNEFLNDVVEISPTCFGLVFGRQGIHVYQLERPYVAQPGAPSVKAVRVNIMVGDRATGKFDYLIGACKVTHRPTEAQQWPDPAHVPLMFQKQKSNDCLVM